MLSRDNRLTLGRDFDLVHKEGYFFPAGNVFLKVRKNGLEKTRIGFSIGLNFSPQAVRRNKARRWLREIAKKQLLSLKPGLDIIVMLKKEKDFPTYRVLADNLQRALLKGNSLIK